MERELTFEDNAFIVSKTDLNGKIKYGNKLFITMSGYTEEEFLGAPHNILRHSDMPKVVFTLLWQQVRSGKEIFAYVKNRTKNGDYYWVFAHVTPSFDTNGTIIGFHSVRRKPSILALRVIEPLYRSLVELEKRSGVSASLDALTKILNEKGVSYDEFILSL